MLIVNMPRHLCLHGLQRSVRSYGLSLHNLLDDLLDNGGLDGRRGRNRLVVLGLVVRLLINGCRRGRGCSNGLCDSLRHNGAKEGIVVNLSRAIVAGAASNLLLLTALLKGANEGELLHLLRDLVDDDLLGAPGHTETGCSEPEAGALEENSDLCALRQEVLNGSIGVELTLGVVELGLKLAALVLAELNLLGGRVALGLITRHLHRGLVHITDDLLGLLLAEPLLRLADGGLDDELIKGLEHLVVLANRAAVVIVAIEREVKAVLKASTTELALVLDTQAEGEVHMVGSLDNELTAIVVNVGLLGLGSRIRADIGDGELGGVEVGSENDRVGHLRRGLGWYFMGRESQINF